METQELNIEAAADSIAADILGKDVPSDDLDTVIDGAADDAVPLADAADDKAPVKDAVKADGKDDAAAHAAIEELPVPQSWKKEMHEHWGKMPRPAQEYYLQREQQMLQGLEGYKGDAEYGRSLRGVLAKHEDILRTQGLQAPQAVEFLFNAHRNLSQGTPEQKMAYLDRVAKTYGLTLPQAAAAVDGAQPTALSPEVKAALERMDKIESALAQDETRRYEEARQVASKDVEAFATDPAHPYFDEVSEDIAKFIRAGEKLASAYEKAVWANPVTRQKEIARIQQASDKDKAEKAKEAAKAAKKATSTNVKGRDTTRAPTEGRATVANMDEVLDETLADIKSRH